MKKKFTITQGNVQNYVEDIAFWIKDKVDNAKKDGVVLGLSGGIDSAVVARLCQVANIKTDLILLPYGNQESKDAFELINKFSFKYSIFDITPIVDLLTKNTKNQLAIANVRPRVRMTYLYQYAQTHNLCVIGTGNLSERTVGYFTKWGDGANDFNPLGMVTKTEVYLLAKHLDVPKNIIEKEPSADLWEGQTDEKEMGISYNDLDKFILSGTSENESTDMLIKEKIKRAEHKLNPVPIYKTQENVI